MSKEINPAIVALADKLEPYFKIEDKKPTIGPEAYLETLSENVTPEMVQLVDDHDSLFLPAVKLAYGRVSQSVLEKDKTIDALTVEVPMAGRNHFDMTYSRSQTFPNPAGSEPVTKYGVIKSALITQAAVSSRGDMARVRDFLSTEALKAFGG